MCCTVDGIYLVCCNEQLDGGKQTKKKKQSPSANREARPIHTCDNYFGAAPVGAALVPAGADVDAGVARLDAGEVQLCSCAQRRGKWRRIHA